MLSIGPVPMTLILLALACAAGTAHVLACTARGDAPLPLMPYVSDMLRAGTLLARPAFILK